VSHENTPAIVRLTMILVFATGLLIGFMVNTSQQTQGQVVTKTTTNLVIYDGVENVCFAGLQSCERILVKLITQASRSIYVAAASPLPNHLSKALTEAAGRGVAVIAIVDEGDVFTDGAANVRTNIGPDLLHHNFIVIDGEVVVISDYGWPPNTNSSIVVIRGWRIAGEFLAEFDRLYGSSRSLYK
jgi:phosphatidylserine/phosphatidylglycerophosphate/cardiolipin synthase-like enzyme